VDDATAEKIAHNNASFRAANDGINESAIEQRFDRDQLIPFICECSDPHCTQIVRLTSDEYAHVRSSARWFVHAVGHEEAVAGAVAPVGRYSRYVLVEKTHRAGEVAESLAPEGPGT
jgi:hypothetical protein